MFLLARDDIYACLWNDQQIFWSNRSFRRILDWGLIFEPSETKSDLLMQCSSLVACRSDEVNVAIDDSTSSAGNGVVWRHEVDRRSGQLTLGGADQQPSSFCRLQMGSSSLEKLDQVILTNHRLMVFGWTTECRRKCCLSTVVIEMIRRSASGR